MQLHNMTEAEWKKKFEDIGALWIFNSEGEGAHALLTSGQHSNGYMNCAKIVEDPDLVSQVAAALIEKITPKLQNATPDYVVGPAYGAITFAHEVARQLKTKFAFTEVEYTDEGKMQVLKRFDIPEGASVLVIEDIKTTGGSALKTIGVLEAAGVSVLPFVGFVLNRTEPMLGDREVISLIDVPMSNWSAEDCELCKKGGEAVRPKSNWDKLAR